MSYGYSRGWGSRSCWSYRSTYCPPVYRYCPPPVVVDPCPPPVVVAPCPPRVVYPSPVVVERPVYVDRVVEKPVVIERAVVVERPVESRPAAAGYRDRELGDAYMKLGDWSNAMRGYARYLSVWDKDGTAVRNLGLAQLAGGNAREGFANVVRGFNLEPGLIDRDAQVQALLGREGVQQMADSAVLAADGVNTAEAWFTVAYLQCLAGQAGSAEAALKKARDGGLSQSLLDSLALKVAALKV